MEKEEPYTKNITENYYIVEVGEGIYVKKISAPLIHLNILDGDVPIVLTNDIDDACKFNDNNSLYQDLIKLEGLKVTEVVVKKSIIIETNHYKK